MLFTSDSTFMVVFVPNNWLIYLQITKLISVNFFYKKNIMKKSLYSLLINIYYSFYTSKFYKSDQKILVLNSVFFIAFFVWLS